MSSSATVNHRIPITNNTPGSKQSSIHPSSTLLYENSQIRRSISECFSIRNISEIIIRPFLFINLQAHYPIFSQILISLSTSRIIITINKLEKLIHRASLYGSPSEQTISSWETGNESKRTLTAFVRSMTKFILKELGSSYEIACIQQTSFLFVLINRVHCHFDLSATSPTIFMKEHIFEQFCYGVVTWSCANIKHKSKLWF